MKSLVRLEARISLMEEKLRVDTEEPIQDPRPVERTLHVEHIVLPPHDEPEYVPNPEEEEYEN